jgi:hypothetical protein
MAKRHRRSRSHSHKKTHRRRHSHRRASRRYRRRNGGSSTLSGAPLRYEMGGMRQSLAQGSQFLKYHEGQHGGMAPVNSITSGPLISGDMLASAHQSGLTKALNDIQGMSDQVGGRRRSRAKSRRHRRSKHTTKSRRHSRRRKSVRRRKGGAALGYAPVGSNSMLLSGSEYGKAGLNPGWKGGPEFTAAAQRATA